AAGAGDRGEADAAAHAFDAFLDDGEADAGAWILGGVQALKDLEDALVEFGGNADAVGLDPDADHAAGKILRAQPYLRGLAGLDELEGVADEVDQDLTQRGGMGHDRWPRRQAFDAGAGGGDFAVTAGERALDGDLKRHRDQLDLLLAHAAEGEEVGEQAVH